jgi:hypothetical protein
MVTFIPPALLHLFENVGWAPSPKPAGRRGALGTMIDVGARLREMWR